MKQEPVEEITIQQEKREEILNELRQVLKKWNTIKPHCKSYWTIQLYKNLFNILPTKT